MSASLERAVILIEQSRFDLAEQELQQQLAINPNNSYAHALLSLCQVERKQYREATKEAEEAVHLAPDLSYAHYTLARVLYSQSKLDKAKIAILEAIRLEPEVADYLALVSAIQFKQGDRTLALASAERGLSIEPEHIICLNLRAMALLELNRLQDALNTIEVAVAQDPENAITYATQGWAFLHLGNSTKALQYFREALRLNPEQDRARTGMIEALKARNLIYRPFLQYDLWVSRLNWQMRLFIIFIIYFIGVFKLQFLLLILLLGIAKPVFTLMLRLDSSGRLTLSRQEIVVSNWSGVMLVLALIALMGWLITGNLGAACATLVCLLLVKFIAELFVYPAGWERKLMGTFVTLLAIGGSLLTAGLLFMNQAAFKTEVGFLLYAALTVFSLVFISFMLFLFGMFFYLLGVKMLNISQFRRSFDHGRVRS